MNDTDIQDKPKEAPAPAEKKPARIHLPANNSNFQQAGFAVNLFDAMIPVDHKLEDILNSEYWLHWSRRIPVLSIIRAYHEGGRFDVDLRVLDVGNGFCKVRIRGGGEYNEASAAEALRPDIRALYTVRHIPNKRYVVQHNATGRIEVENLPNREDADKWLNEHVHKLAR